MAALAIAAVIVIGAIEVNAVKGKLGPMTTVKGAIGCGFALTAIMVLVLQIFV